MEEHLLIDGLADLDRPRKWRDRRKEKLESGGSYSSSLKSCSRRRLSPELIEDEASKATIDSVHIILHQVQREVR